MSLDLFQIICIPVMSLAYVFSVLTAPDRARRVVEISALATSAWIGEHTVIDAYQFYYYADGWWMKLGHVPLLVALIWPMVVLSARDVVGHVFGQQGHIKRAFAVGAVVVFDASIMEVIAVHGGLWRWFEGGYLGVPLMGIVGWGCFGLVATLWLDRLERSERVASHALTPIVTVAATHALLLAVWWASLRWVLRGDLGAIALLGFAAAAAGYAWMVWRARARGLGALPGQVTAPRALATSVFVGLLITLADSGLQWGHLCLAAGPYLLTLRWSGRDAPGSSPGHAAP